MDSSSSQADLMEQLADEFAARQRRGEQPSLDEYVERYPELASEIHDIFPALVMMEQVVPAASDLKQTQRTADAPSETIPKTVGEFRILREIGRGGMGVVYEAEQESLRRRVALKVLPSEISGSARSMERFQREARAAARMHHTNIVPVFEVGQDGNTAFYAMQLIQGQALDLVIDDLRRLRNEHTSRSRNKIPLPSAQDAAPSIAASLVSGQFHQDDLATEMEADSMISHREKHLPFTETFDHKLGSTASAALPGESEISTAETNRTRFHRSVAQVGIQTADALAYAHARGIIHRDIKPSNLVLDAGGVVWVTDFGLAKTHDEAMTHTGDILGTMRYMSPERFRGQCDVRADVYSLGLTLYELLVLKPAFESPDQLKLIEMVRQLEPPTPREVDPRVPRDLETIVLKSIDKDPKRRYQSADELCEDLRRFVDDEPIRARRISLPERLFRWSRRNRGIAALLVVITVLVFAAAVGSGVAANYFRELANKEAAAREETRRQFYVADMNVAVQEWEEGNVARVVATLERHQPIKGEEDLRGFEWYHLWQSCSRSLETPVLEHEGLVAAVAFSPIEDKLATAGSKWVNVWDLARHEKLLTFESDEKWVYDVAFSPDGRKLATGNSNSVKIWDLDSGLPPLTLHHDKTVSSVEFSPDGRFLASGSSSGTATLWDASTGDEHRVLTTSSGRVVTCVAFSSKGRLLAVGDRVGRVAVFDVHSGTEIEMLSRGSGVQDVDFSSDDQTIAVKLFGSQVVLWDWKNERAKDVPVGGKWREVGTIAFSPISDTFAVDGPANTIEIRNGTTGDLVDSIAGHSGTIGSAEFSPTGKQLASASSDGTVRLWDVTTTSSHSMIEGHRFRTETLAFSPDGGLLVSGGATEVKLWDTRTWRLHSIVDEQVSRYGVTFSADGDLLAYAAIYKENPVVQVWDVRRQQVRHAIPYEGGFLHSMAFSPDSRCLAIVDPENTIRIWDLTAQEQLTTLRGHTGLVERVVFSPNGKTLASGSWDFTVKLWDVATGELRHDLVGHKQLIRGLVFPKDGKTLISGSTDGTIRMWDVTMGRQVDVLSENIGAIQSLALSGDEMTLAIAADNSVILWDLHRQRERVQFRAQTGVLSVAFSPDSKILVGGLKGGSIRIWQAADPDEVRRAGW